MVRNVKRIIERHPLTIQLKPPRSEEWASDRFTIIREQELRDPSMLAKGIGSNITGARADVIICDDVEVPKTCDTPGKRNDLRERLDEIEYVLVPGGTKLFVGTPHTRDSIYALSPPEHEADEPYLFQYDRLELPLINDDGQSLWPERFPLDHIEKIKKRSGPAKFASQMMLRPTSIVDGRLDPDRLVPYEAELDYREAGGEAVMKIGSQRLVSATCWWDPAYGASGRGDASVIAAVFTDEDGNYRLHDIRYMTHTPPDQLKDQTDEVTQQCRQALNFAKNLHLPAINIETNGLGKFLPGLLRKEIAEANLSIAVIETHSKRAKHMRIVDAFDAPLAANRLYAHTKVLSTPLIEEMREWRPHTSSRDDGLDAIAGCLLSEPIRLKRTINSNVTPQRAADWRHGSQAYKASTEFSL